jgi:hypothetical protein
VLDLTGSSQLGENGVKAARIRTPSGRLVVGCSRLNEDTRAQFEQPLGDGEADPGASAHAVTTAQRLRSGDGSTITI